MMAKASGNCSASMRTQVSIVVGNDVVYPFA